MSTTPVVAGALAGYLALVFGIREVMKDKEPKKLNFLFRVHNAFLSSGSAILLALMLEEIGPIVYNHGFFYGICNKNAWTPVRDSYHVPQMPRSIADAMR